MKRDNCCERRVRYREKPMWKNKPKTGQEEAMLYIGHGEYIACQSGDENHTGTTHETKRNNTMKIIASRLPCNSSKSRKTRKLAKHNLAVAASEAPILQLMVRFAMDRRQAEGKEVWNKVISIGQKKG